MRIKFRVEIPGTSISYTEEHDIPGLNQVDEALKSLQQVAELFKLRGQIKTSTPGSPPIQAMVVPTYHATHAIGEAEIRLLKETWHATLAYFKIFRPLNQMEELEIERAAARWGFEHVELALYGARYEPKNDSFNPKDYVSIVRVFGKDRYGQDRITLFENWGAKHRAELLEKLKAPEPEPEYEAPDPIKVREILAKAGFGRQTGRDEPSGAAPSG